MTSKNKFDLSNLEFEKELKGMASKGVTAKPGKQRLYISFILELALYVKKTTTKTPYIMEAPNLKPTITHKPILHLSWDTALQMPVREKKERESEER